MTRRTRNLARAVLIVLAFYLLLRVGVRLVGRMPRAVKFVMLAAMVTFFFLLWR